MRRPQIEVLFRYRYEGHVSVAEVSSSLISKQHDSAYNHNRRPCLC